ncbi:GNAT family N-acetyltransferase [Dysgonomonas sp. GY617]|nr:GNAT family N-acetyltransferase [Dysgonomonas sp. GY617]
MMELKLITYQSPEYDEMVALRYSVLREPLGLVFTKEDLLKDENDLLLVACLPKSERIVGCCILTPLNEHTVQLRQMAIAPFMQGKGLGAQLLQFAENTAKDLQHRYIYLHARKIAVDFYKKHNYTIEGDQFTEVGIPHFEMLKQLN